MHSSMVTRTVAMVTRTAVVAAVMDTRTAAAVVVTDTRTVPHHRCSAAMVTRMAAMTIITTITIIITPK